MPHMHQEYSEKAYQQQLENKLQALSESAAVANVVLPENLPIFTSPITHFRQRVEFKIWHQDDTAHYAMFEQARPKQPIFLEQFPVASKRINELMPKIMQWVNQHDIVRHKLFQIDFLDTTIDDTLITFIYHKPLVDAWQENIVQLKQQLHINIIGRSKKQKIILDRDFVTEELSVNNKTYCYQQIENSFTQPNSKVCEKMLQWAVDQSENFSGDLLELYCGNGNFTLPLAKNFTRVFATEISKTSVRSALFNAKQNAVGNITIARLSSEEFCQAFDKVRPFTRLKDINLDDYNFSTVFVDPPRVGLDALTLKLCSRFENIIYISCNKESLLKNLIDLSSTHRIETMAVFDQFPYTEHLELGVVLKKAYSD